MLLSVDKEEFEHHVTVGSCASYHDKEVTINMHKEMFMWVDPESIEKYSPGILQGLMDQNETKVEAKLTDNLLKIGADTYKFVDGTGIHDPDPNTAPGPNPGPNPGPAPAPGPGPNPGPQPGPSPHPTPGPQPG